MVSITSKIGSSRSATAIGRVRIPFEAYELLTDKETETERPAGRKQNKKGDALAVAQLAGFMGAKKTSELIPLCHPLNLTNVQVALSVLSEAQPAIISSLSLAREDRTCKGEAEGCSTLEHNTQHQERRVVMTTAYFVQVEATTECQGATGVEMEALTAVSVACLTVWDMLKAVAGREMVIEDLKVVRKSGGKSGDWARVRVDTAAK